MHDFTEKDKEILYNLDTNSRKSIRRIAKEVNIPENSLRYRIKRLEDKHVIIRYYTSINSYNFGFNVIKFYTKYININSAKKRQIIDYFSKMPNTWVVSTLEGEFDLGIIFWVHNINSFYPIWNKIFVHHGEYLTNSKLFFQYEALSFRPTYLITNKIRPENEKYDITRQEKQLEISKNDMKILQSFSSNAKTSIIKLSREMNLTSSTISNRIKNLKKNGVIQSYRIDIDVSKLGLYHIKADVFLNNLKDISKVIKSFKKCPYVVCIMKSIGHSDVEIEFHVKNIAHFHQLMMKFMDKNPKTIKNYTFFQGRISHKLRWIPQIIKSKNRSNMIKY